MEADKDGYNIDVVSKPFTPEEQHNQFKALSDNEMSQEILRMIIRSVQKSERRKSSRNNKRKRQVKPTTQTNGSDADDEKKAYSRCSITFLFEVLQKVRSCPKYVELVKWMGFGEILELDACVVPRSFVKWIADNVCTEKEEIRIDSKSVPLTPQSVKDTLGTPTGELSVDSDELIGKAAFLALFGLTEVPSIRYFGKKILAKEILPDDVFCRCFMAVSLGTFYCPNSNTKLSTKYMGALVDVDKIKDRNWTKFIHEWLMIYIKKFLKEPKNAKHLTQTLGGCIYHLAVRLLDFIDFGSIQMPTTLPRIKVWKGSLIKVFSDMYMGTTGKFGAYPIKDISQTCYADNTNKDTGGVSSDETLKNSINTAIGDTVGYKLKEVISTTFVNIMKDEDCGVCAKAQDLVLQVLHAFLSNENGSQDTVKLSSSAQGSYKTAINTGSTEKIQSQDEEVDYDNDALIRRKRRRTEENSSSQHSIESNNTRIHQQKTQYQDSTHTKSTIPEGTKLYSQNEQAASDVAFSQGVQSASLQHMLAENNVTPNSTTPCMDVSSKETNPLNKHNDTIGVIASLMDLNIKCNEDENQDFSSFDGHDVKDDSLENLDRALADNKTTSQNEICAKGKDIDINMPNFQTIAENYARIQLQPAIPIKRSRYLEIARSKYFFRDEGTSFRLMEDVDDNGKPIEEPELYRPVWMDDYTYNEKCELAIAKCKESESKFSEKDASNTSFSNKRNTSSANQSVDNNDTCCETTIQCAQRQPRHTGLTDSPTWPSKAKDNFVNLLTPEALVTSQDHVNLKESTTSERQTPDYRKAIIVGRRLFEGNSEDYNDSNSKDKSLAKEMRTTIEIQDSPPDVQILSVRSLKNTHNRMSQETDEMYNTSLSLGNSTSHYGKENFLPQRIPQRSKVYCSPFDVNPSAPPVEPIEQKIWEAVTTLCDIEDHKTMWAVNIDNIRVSMSQLGSSMKLNGKVEAWLMNSFCRKLFRDNHPRTTNKHFFFNTTSDYFLKKWKSEDARIHWQKKAIESLIWANKAKSLLSSDGLYFPSVFNNHWFVFLVDMKYRNFIFLDSFFGKNSTFHKEVANLMIESFEKTWQEAGFRNINFKTFGRAYPNVPKQRNGSNDCGIFVMKYMEFFCARNQSKCTFSHLDIPIFRVKYAHDILMCDYNSEYEAKILAAGFNA